MARNFASGISSVSHRALVLAAIEERVAAGESREDAATAILDQEYAWRREELAASRWSLRDEFAEIGEIFSRGVRGLVRHPRDQ